MSTLFVVGGRLLFMLNSSIIGFYGGTHPDHRGRYLREIQQWQDSQLEAVHDYIQWLFPLPERSGFNVAAPVLNPKSIQEFRNQPDLKDNLRDSFRPHDELLRS
jgi:hypothetical protein